MPIRGWGRSGWQAVDIMDISEARKKAILQRVADWRATNAHLLQGLQEIEKRLPLKDEEESVINNFKIGCDPEFMLLDGRGNPVPASDYLPHFGPIGYDHGGRVAEFRPDPVKGTYGLVKKIHALIESPTLKKAEKQLRGGAYCAGDCLGGHVHFGFNAFEEKPPGQLGTWAGGRLNARGSQVTKALDALTKVLEHLDILPKAESAQRRKSSQGGLNHYGEYGDVRDCAGHMEYRTMASWLFDPKVAFLCLTGAKLAATDPEATYASLKTCTSFSDLSKWIEQYKGKDLNAARVSEKLVGGGLKNLQVDPSVDFRKRWEMLGL